MTYYGAKHLAEGFRTVRKNTITIAEEIPADKYHFRATPDVMSVAEMLAHVAASYLWQIEAHGRHMPMMEMANFVAWREQAAAAEKALVAGGRDAILRGLKENGDKMAAFLESLDEQTLAEPVAFAPPAQPPTKTRFEMLLGIKEHEMHHRGQLMVVQRLLGQVPHLTRARQQMRAAATQRG